tara:strand:+ start:186 stop:869 length:684 start_codon:yes stop_codon:yes gene_type:complete
MTVQAADNRLTPAERDAGWKLLFDGKSFDGWMTSDSKPSRRPIEQSAINPHRCGAYMMVHKQMWTDFRLKLDFKISPKCNSGIFFRTWTLKKIGGNDVGFNGLEIAIDDTRTAGYHDTGALYDLVKPTRNAMKPAGEWNHMELTCRGQLVRVVVNGIEVQKTDLSRFDKKNVRPDGTPHKFPFAFKDHPRRGHIGLQDHGSDCWFKNIKLLDLSKRPKRSGTEPNRK